MPIDLTVALINATVQIDQQQTDKLRLVGAGFLVSAPKPDGTPRTVLVTAAHLLKNFAGPDAQIGWRSQDPSGAWRFTPRPLPIRDGALQLWAEDPDHDIAAIEVKAPPEFARAAVPLSWLAEEKDLKAAAIGPGDEMMALGFPEGYAANKAGFPIVRVGWVASYPVTPVSEFQTFLLDFRVFTGNSGGPVFVTEDLRRRPGVAEAKGQFVAGMLIKESMAGSERLELGVVAQATFIRRTIGLLDHPPAGAAPPP